LLPAQFFCKTRFYKAQHMPQRSGRVFTAEPQPTAVHSLKTSELHPKTGPDEFFDLTIMQ